MSFHQETANLLSPHSAQIVVCFLNLTLKLL